MLNHRNELRTLAGKNIASIHFDNMAVPSATVPYDYYVLTGLEPVASIDVGNDIPRPKLCLDLKAN